MYNEIILLNNKFIFLQDTLIFLGNVLFFQNVCFFGRMYLFILLQISENLYTVYRKKLMYV